MRQFPSVLLLLLLCIDLPVITHALSDNSEQRLFNNIKKARKLETEGTNHNEIVLFLDSVYQEFIKEKYEYGQGRMCLELGEAYLIIGNFPAAYKSYEEAIRIFEPTGDSESIVRAYAGLGTVEGRRGNLDIANEYFIKGLHISERINFNGGTGSLLLKLGVVNEKLKNFDLAVDYYNRALPYLIGGDHRNVITIHSNIGRVLVASNKLDESIPHLETALKESEDKAYEYVRILPLTNLGEVYAKKGEHEKALQYYEEGIKLAEKHQLKEETLNLKAKQAVMLAEQSPNTAAQILSSIFQESDKLGIYYIAENCAQELIQLYKQLNNDKQVIHWMEAHQRITLLMYDESKASEVSNMQALYELNNSKANIDSLNEKIKLKERADLYFIMAISLLSAGLILTFYMNKRQRKTNALLRAKESELLEKDKIKDRLFSIIGHDIKGAISTQYHGLELLKNEFTSPSDKTSIVMNNMHKNLDDVHLILDTLLHWGKLQIKNTYLPPLSFNAYAIINKKTDMVKASSDLKQITIINQVSPDTYVYAVLPHFEFILRNLLNNAIKYSYQESEIIIGAHTDHSKNANTFFVKDYGTGVHENEKKHLFTPFHQSQEGTNYELGNGLALMICKEFIEMNHGKIWYENHTDCPGCTFYFQLPIRDSFT